VNLKLKYAIFYERKKVTAYDIIVPLHARGCANEKVPGLWDQERLRGQITKLVFLSSAGIVTAEV
jgi:hypothetical protein